MDTIKMPLQMQLQQEFPAAVVETHDRFGDGTAVVCRESLMEVARFLKDDARFAMNVLMDLTVVDGLELNWSERFEVVYHFYSLAKNHRLRLKVRLKEKEAVVPSLTALWPSANWFEREAWDMFGVVFEGHPDLRRILMYESFKGHPLRKDYAHNKRQPLIGPKN